MKQEKFSARFDQALIVAALAHDGQMRKATCIPYIIHSVAVAQLLERHGYPEDVTIGGLLHDVIEDTECADTRVQLAFKHTFPELERAPIDDVGFRDALRQFIRQRFGQDVLRLVESVTELKSDQGGKRPWRVRKEEQLAHMAEMQTDELAIKAADALHNAQSIARDAEAQGVAMFQRFNASRDDTLWYYERIAEEVKRRLGPTNALGVELSASVAMLTASAERNSGV